MTAQWSLGTPNLNHVVVVYAHNGPQTNEYNASLQKIRNFGILAANLIEIEKLKVGTFGINNLGQLGY